MCTYEVGDVALQKFLRFQSVVDEWEPSVFRVIERLLKHRLALGGATLRQRDALLVIQGVTDVTCWSLVTMP